MSSELILVIILALVFEFINGMRDSSNIVATMISSRAFRPNTALGVTAVAEFLGPFLFGVTVAKTVGGDIVDSHLLTLDALVACLLGAIIWNMVTWYLGIPSSSSHALIGGLIGVGFGLVALIIFATTSQVPLSALPYGTALLLMGLCIAVALIAALSSAWSASGEKPLNVLRYE